MRRHVGERALIVRPGLIVDPGNRSGRFSHWPWRTAAGGEMLVPDVPGAEPLQVIDVRGLAEWMVLLLERGERGVFNATGPASGRAEADDGCCWPALVDVCVAAVSARGGTPAKAVRVDEAFLLERGVAPWRGLPLWLHTADADHAGFNRVDVMRATRSGLRTRPLRDTVDAVLNESVPPADDPRRAGKLTIGREAELIARWRALGKGEPVG